MRSRTRSMFTFMWWPMRSKRKPSTLYCTAHVTSESTMSFSIMAFSVAVFSQQVERSTSPVMALRRW